MAIPVCLEFITISIRGNYPGAILLGEIFVTEVNIIPFLTHELCKESSETRYGGFLAPVRLLPCRLPATALALVYETIICICTSVCLCYSVCG